MAIWIVCLTALGASTSLSSALISGVVFVIPPFAVLSATAKVSTLVKADKGSFSLLGLSAERSAVYGLRVLDSLSASLWFDWEGVEATGKSLSRVYFFEERGPDGDWNVGLTAK